MTEIGNYRSQGNVICRPTRYLLGPLVPEAYQIYMLTKELFSIIFDLENYMSSACSPVATDMAAQISIIISFLGLCLLLKSLNNPWISIGSNIWKWEITKMHKNS